MLRNNSLRHVHARTDAPPTTKSEMMALRDVGVCGRAESVLMVIFVAVGVALTRGEVSQGIHMDSVDFDCYDNTFGYVIAEVGVFCC